MPITIKAAIIGALITGGFILITKFIPNEGRGTKTDQIITGNDNIQTVTTGDNSPILFNNRKITLPIQLEYNTDDISDIAFAIYTEVLGNVKKINVCMNKIDAGEEIDFGKIKFSQELYEKHYKAGLFGSGELDKQLANFYNNLNSIDILFKKGDFIRIKAQGDHVLQLLSERYGCQDYDIIYPSEQNTDMTAASGDVTISAPATASKEK